MKNFDVISKRIAVTGIVACAILLCASVFMFSLGTVSESQASVPANKYLTPVAAGQVMMSPYLDKDGYQNILVWNTETGKSVSWYVNTSTNICKKNAYQLPDSPF